MLRANIFVIYISMIYKVIYLISENRSADLPTQLAKFANRWLNLKSFAQSIWPPLQKLMLYKA
jgi:hypothetical protein